MVKNFPLSINAISTGRIRVDLHLLVQEHTPEELLHERIHGRKIQRHGDHFGLAETLEAVGVYVAVEPSRAEAVEVRDVSPQDGLTPNQEKAADQAAPEHQPEQEAAQYVRTGRNKEILTVGEVPLPNPGRAAADDDRREHQHADGVHAQHRGEQILRMDPDAYDDART